MTSSPPTTPPRRVIAIRSDLPSGAASNPRDIRITGTLTTGAEFRLTPRGHGTLTVYVTQGPGTHTWRAVQNIDPTPAALIAARAKAHRLQRGTVVTVWAKYAPASWTPGDRHIALHDITDITEHTRSTTP